MIETIGIVGAGTMGLGIAQLGVTAGQRVILCETNAATRERAPAVLKKSLAREVEKGRLTAEACEQALGRLEVTAELSSLAKAECVIEAIIESLPAKRELFASLEGIVTPTTLLASNTSSLSIASLCGDRKHPERVIGLHFFNPAPVMKLVEIIPALRTSSDSVEKCRALVQEWKKTAVVAKDTPGFIVNRVARPFYSEALRLAEEGVAFETIDSSMRALGFKMGPFELMDLIGNDVNYAVTCSVFEAFYYDSRFRPSVLQRRLVESGLLGRKTQRGFYEYVDGQPKAPANLPTADAKVGERILAMLINEAHEALRLKVATKQDLDQAMMLGVNYPKGLIAWGEELGRQRVAEILDELRSYFGEERYRASPLLRQ